ncbi:MAG TPA: hypothetical protein ENI11_05480, partial [Actinobacteria bacterium]|nr:hypothetical protein [Actinomycetota bacterium]
DGEFYKSVGLVVDVSEKVYVTDHRIESDPLIAPVRIQNFDSTGTHLNTWGTHGIGPRQLIKPAGIGVDSAGNSYVADFENNKVVKFNSSKVAVDEWGSFGSGKGQFSGPWGVAVAGSTVYVTDSYNHRVQRFNLNGGFQKQWHSPGADLFTFEPRGIAIDSGGQIFVTDIATNKVKVFKEVTAVNNPTGTVLINNGASNTSWSLVSLKLSAIDSAGNPVDYMRFSNDGFTWYGWGPFKPITSWTLNGNKGTNTVYAQFMDTNGLISVKVSDTIILDNAANPPAPPKVFSAEVKAPRLTTRYHNRADFKVSWKAVGALPPGGVTSYDVKYKINRKGSWRQLLTNTKKKITRIKGRPGRTYRTRARAHGADGTTTKWSKVKTTVIPQDNGTSISKRRGFGKAIKKKRSKTYLRTIRRSTRRGDYVTYRFKGKAVFLVTTMGRYYSKADIYVNGKFMERVNGFSHRTRFRKVLWGKSWGKYRTRTLKIVNVGNKRRIDLDALAVLR